MRAAKKQFEALIDGNAADLTQRWYGEHACSADWYLRVFIEAAKPGGAETERSSIWVSEKPTKF